MRPLTDAKGVIVQIEFIRGDDAYAGMLEGTPYLARKFRLRQGRRRMESPGVFVFGLDELEREIAETAYDTEVWAPNEYWIARLVGQTDWKDYVRRYLLVHWYQEGGDPIAQLADLVATLDFTQHSLKEEIDRDN